MLSYVFHPLAESELDEAVEHYESVQRGKGLELLDAVESALEHIRSFPKAAPRTRGTIRSKILLPRLRWHYTIHYRLRRDTIRVLAFAHQKRQPFYWLGRT